jgi:hypothetical protein
VQCGGVFRHEISLRLVHKTACRSQRAKRNPYN